VRVLLDANVLISALLAKTGAPARLLRLCIEGDLELVICPALLLEVEETLGRKKLRARVDPSEATRFLDELAAIAEVVPDPETQPPLRSADPDDDHLLALAAREKVPLVSGDDHLLALSDRAPVYSPRDFLDELEE
jgi:putative PIN family toxin of toxin-antitoxin system